jgi:hypothetical protein
MRKVRRLDLTMCTVNGECVILDRASGFVHQLNATASHIWSACDGRHTVEEIAACVAARFASAPDTVLHDVIRTLADLERLGLLVDVPVDVSA